MNRATLTAVGAAVLAATGVVAHAQTLPAPLLAQFEQDAGVKLQLVKGGDAGEMLNKLILTRAKPIADVVFGIDNALWHKAHAAQVLHAAGISPAVMVTFFERIRDALGDDTTERPDDEDGASLPISIASHPAHEERIRFFRDWQPGE